MVDEQTACSRQQAKTVGQIDALNALHVLKHLCKNGVRDELHASKGEHLYIWRHPANLVNHVVLDPVVILKVQAQRLLGKVRPEILFVQNSPRLTFQVLDFLPIIILFKTDIV